jgi:hypothetical protein
MKSTQRTQRAAQLLGDCEDLVVELPSNERTKLVAARKQIFSEPQNAAVGAAVARSARQCFARA